MFIIYTCSGVGIIITSALNHVLVRNIDDFHRRIEYPNACQQGRHSFPLRGKETAIKKRTKKEIFTEINGEEYDHL